MMKPPFFEEDPRHKVVSGFLSYEAYAEATSSLVLVCSDVVAVDEKERIFWLTKRRVQSAKGIWVFGGRRRAGETAVQAIMRSFKRETTLDLPEDRFSFVTMVEHTWTERKEEPTDLGVHEVIFLFKTTLGEEERRTIEKSLDEEEYDTRFGLKPFDRKRLVEEGARPVLLHYYDIIFGA